MNIIIPAESSSALRNAANELKKYLTAICPADFDIAFTLRISKELAADALSITAAGGVVCLEGGNDRGVLYAVYRLLEHLGCRFYAEDTEVVPSMTAEDLTATLADGLCIREASPFEYRDLFWVGTYQPAFAVKLRLNAGAHARKLPAEWGREIGYAAGHFVHTFERLVPAQEFFETHPEYFSMINGERTAKHLYSQLCLSNPDVFDIVVTRVKQCLRQNPQAQIVSVSQNDSFVIESYCTCPACAAVDAEEGSAAGSLLRFVNRVAEAIEPEFPNVAVDTLAYQYSTVPPQKTKPRHNVMVRLCTGYCISHPLTICEKNRAPREAMERWSEICDRLYVWDYTTDFHQYLAPCPNLKSLMPNLRFFAEHNVKGVFEQGNYQTGKSGEFGELRAYILARGMWSPTECPDVKSFMEAYYGAGAPYIEKYLEYLHEKTKDMDVSPVFACSALWNPLIDDEELAMLDGLWADAYTAAVQGDVTANGFGISAALAAEHVERSALCHRWLKMDCKRGEFADEALFEERKEAFFADCNRLGVDRISEGENIPWVET